MKTLNLDSFFALQDVGTIEVVGHANVLAVAYDDQNPIVLYLAGSTTSVNAVRAAVNGLKKRLNLKISRAIQRYGNKVLKADAVMKAYNTRDEHLEEDYMLMLSTSLVTPQAGDKYAYAFCPTDEAEPGMSEYTRLMFGQRIKSAVKVPVVQDWYAPLIQRGIKDTVIRRMDGYGCRVWRISMSEDYWTENISGMLASGTIEFPPKKNF